MVEQLLTVKADFTELSRYLSDIQRKQLAYVTARATTRLAQKSQQYVRANLAKHFTVRSSWISRGIRIERGEKSDWPAVQAVVGSVDWFMEAQETGVDRTPQGGRKSLPVPAKDIRPTKGTRIPRSKFPKALLAKRGSRRFFLQQLKSGMHAGQLAVLRRSTGERYPLQVLYVLAKKTKGKPRLHMLETVTGVVARYHGPIFLEEMQRALQPKNKAAAKPSH